MTSPQAATEARCWTLDLPPAPYSTPNSREHWAAKARKARAWRHNAAWLARQAHIPRLEAIHVSLTFWPGDRRRRDPDNLMLVVKWCIDGLRDAGVVDDDDGGRVSFDTPRIISRPDGERSWALHVMEATS